MVLLHQINPIEPGDSPENERAQQHHARQVCGIVAHTKDRGVASVAIRSMAISSSVLRERHEQDEVLAIFIKINKETGWRLGKVHEELQRAWGWSGVAPATATPRANHPSSSFLAQQHAADALAPAVMMASVSVPLAAPVPRVIINPLLANSDFSNKNHPYNNFYRPPNQANTTRDSQHLWFT